jgi:hypothetical protein
MLIDYCQRVNVGELPFDADILDLAVLVLEGSQDGFDDFEAE